MKIKSDIIILINDIHAATCVPPIPVARRKQNNQTVLSTASKQKNQAFHIFQSQLCVTIWKLFFFFTQMKTAGCLTCCTNTSPEALPHTSEWESLATTVQRQPWLWSPQATKEIQWEQFHSSLTIPQLIPSRSWDQEGFGWQFFCQVKMSPDGAWREGHLRKMTAMHGKILLNVQCSLSISTTMSDSLMQEECKCLLKLNCKLLTAQNALLLLRFYSWDLTCIYWMFIERNGCRCL